MKIALGIEYNGTQYCGWQHQDNAPSVQDEIESALTQIAQHPVQTICAGRTDSGVHALAQVIHFETKVERKDKAWVLGVNTHLPNDICIRWMQPVDNDFSARFTATARRYRYVIDNQRTSPAVFNKLVTWHARPLDEKVMHAAAQALLGEQDFTSFRSSQCQSKTPMRNIHHISVIREGHSVIIDITANAFLHHMVRNIVGVLIRIGEKKEPVEWVREVLAAKDRRAASMTAAASGLYLFEVTYPSRYSFPASAQHIYLA